MQRSKDNHDEEIVKLTQEAENNLQGWKRALADYENYKVEVEKLLERRHQQTEADIVEQMAPILDTYRLALSHVPPVERESQWFIGLQHIEKQFSDFLASRGIEEIAPPAGSPFDHNEHEAVDMVTDGSVSSQQIAQVVSPGYRLNGSVIKPAKVIVHS